MKLETRVDELEKRITVLENRTPVKVTKTKKVSKRIHDDEDEDFEESGIVHEFHKIIDSRKNKSKKSVLINGGFIHLKDGDNKVKTPAWSSIYEMDTDEQYERFIYKHDAATISELCSQISSKEKLEIIRKLILKGPLSQSEILKEIGISQGQFYHYIKDLINFKLVERKKQDQYDVTERGHLFILSFLNATNSFIQMLEKEQH